MFEKVVLRRSVDGPALTAGELAEALLYYQNTHIVLDYGTLSNLMSSIGMPYLLGVLSRPEVSAVFIEQIEGTFTNRTARGAEYSFVGMRVEGSKEHGVAVGKRKRIQHYIERAGYDRQKAKRYAERFLHLVKVRNLADSSFVDGGILKAATRDLVDADYVSSAARIAALELSGGYPLPNDFYYRIHSKGDRFSVSTNLDFAAIARHQRRIDPDAAQRTEAHIASALLSASSASIYAGYYGGDFYTSASESEIIKIRHSLLLQRTQLNSEARTAFQGAALGDTPSIADTINNGSRSFLEFLELLKKTKRFKAWLRQQGPDQNLAHVYVQDIASVGWLDKLPTKAARYVVGTVVGVIAPVAGLLLSASDTFLLDKLLRGWRPNQFVDDKLRPFLDADD